MSEFVDVTPRPPFAVFAAIDISHGQCARPGAQMSDEYADPVEVAQKFVAEGARLLHVVDLDQAREHGHNTDVIADVIAASKVPVQVSGGINSQQRMHAAFDAGAMWVNLSSDSLLQPDWVAKAMDAHLGRLSASLDIDEAGNVRSRGSDIEVGSLHDTLATAKSAMVPRFVVTARSAEGAMTGPDIELCVDVARLSGAHVIASGGIRDAADIGALAQERDHGVIGAIVGTALYTGSITLAEANDAAALRPRR